MKSVFVGTVEISWHCLRAILSVDRVDAILTMPIERSEKISAFSNFQDIGDKHDIPVYEEPNINAPHVTDLIREIDPDIVYVIGWPRLVKEPLLSMPPKGCVGIHSSLLPKYRGGAPVNWGLIHGEKEWGISVMYLGEGPDTGDVIHQESFPVGPDDTCADVYAKATEACIRSLRIAVPMLATGTAPRHAQNEAEATLFKQRKPHEGLIDWNQPARRVHDWIRAMTHPYPGAFTHLNGHPIHLWRSSVLDEHNTGVPGTIVAVHPYRGLEVQCAPGTVLIHSLQPGNDREMPATVWDLHEGPFVGQAFGGDQT